MNLSISTKNLDWHMLFKVFYRDRGSVFFASRKWLLRYFGERLAQSQCDIIKEK